MGKHSSGKRAEKRSSLASARANLRESLSGLRQGIARFAHSVASAPGMKYLRHGARSVTSVGWAVGASVLLAALVSYLWGWVEAFFIACAGAGALLIAIIWVIVHGLPALGVGVSLSLLKPAAKIVAMGTGAVCNYLGYRFIFTRKK